MKDLIAVVGPTATGKTEYAIQLAERLGGEIVSCDSMQLYKFMDIGSAKPSEEERRKVRHYLVDEIDPRTPFSVVQYQRMAKQAIQEIYEKGKLPILAGGTGLYLNSILYEMDFRSKQALPGLPSIPYRPYQRQRGALRSNQPAGAAPDRTGAFRRSGQVARYGSDRGTYFYEGDRIQGTH